MDITHAEFCTILDSFLKNYEAFLRDLGFPVKAGEIRCKNLDEVIEAMPRHTKSETLKRLEEWGQKNESKRVARVA